MKTSQRVVLPSTSKDGIFYLVETRPGQCSRSFTSVNKVPVGCRRDAPPSLMPLLEGFAMSMARSEKHYP